MKKTLVGLSAALLVAATVLAAGKPKATIAEPLKDVGTVSKGELLPALDASVFGEPVQEYPAALVPR